MRLTVLGSGMVISGPERATTGFALELANEIIVIDLGFGCFKNLQKAGIDFSKVNKLFITHFEHLDHVNDLPAFLIARKGLVDLGISNPVQINIFAGPGFKDFIERLFNAYPTFKDLPFKLSVSELESFGTKKFLKFILTTKPMKHAKSSIGLKFQAGNKSVVFSGDTEFNENLVGLAKDTDLLVAECTYAAEKPAWNHLNAEQLAKIASRANAKAVLLSHLSPKAEKANLRALVARDFKGKIFVAKDLMQVSV